MQERQKSNVIPTQEEIEQLRKETLKEMNYLNSEIQKNRKKRFSLIVYIFIGIIIFRFFFGTIELYNILGYPPSKSRFYKVTVNDEPISVSYSIHHQIPIIPFLIHFNSYYLGTNNVKGKETITFQVDDLKKYIIDINSYNCYKGNSRVSCKYDNQTMKENKDTKYTQLIITRISNPWEEIYNGAFKNDITPYIEKKGVYCIQIIAKYSLIETEVYFYLNNKV